MTVSTRSRPASSAERFARLYASCQAWVADLEATPDDVQRHLDSPVARALLGEDVLDAALDSARGARAPAGPGISMTELRQLESCQTQEGFCEVLARADDGPIVLREVVPHIRRAGLSEAKSDVFLVKNLGTWLMRSGRWDRVRPGVYRLRDGL